MPAFQPLELGMDKRGPASNQRNPNPRADNGPADAREGDNYWMVQWRKPQYKKHKTWDGDGILVMNSTKAQLYDTDGKTIASGRVPVKLSRDAVFFVGDKEVEFDRPLTQEEFSSGFGFTSGHASPVNQPPAPKSISCKPYITVMRTTMTNPPSIVAQTPTIAKHPPVNWKAMLRTTGGREETVFVALANSQVTVLSKDGALIYTIPWQGGEFQSGLRFSVETEEIELEQPVETSPTSDRCKVNSTSVRGRSIAKQNTDRPPQHKEVKPLHDPESQGAIIMKTPREFHQGYQKYHVVPVVLDPILANKMRPHQIEGVKFMYECVMGLRKHEGQGCILADEMGLGKSLQTIALIWTLLKQNPYASLGPAAKKVLVVCPVTVINNWKAEFYKWLGRDRVNVVVCDKDAQVAQTFANAKMQQVLIIGYERLKTVLKYISFSVPPIDLIICDEGHRLKSSSNKTRETFRAFRTTRKIVLSGTPIQNDLREFHAIADFCNPGLLDDYPTFRRMYETPITRGRAPDASVNEVELGKLRSTQLHVITKSFVLRRETGVIQSRLPPKHEYVVFVVPTPLQLALYTTILQSEKIDNLVQSSQSESLALINMLVKISNSPILLKATIDSSREKIQNSSGGLRADDFRQIIEMLPQRVDVADVSLSGKLIALSKLLQLIYQETNEKCVLVSHYTSTLNILEAYCKRNKFTFLRLDGQTPAPKRQEVVDKFNKSSQDSCFIFLLSSKAGGVGINLIGASRLCLVDCDWNPSHDVQAMARCHRDGQKRPVFIYRLLTTGTIDEKIYQRQVTKLGLSNSLIGDNLSSKGDSFNRNDLRDIFRVDATTSCNTHDLLQCACNGFDISNTESLEPEPTGFVAASQVKADRPLKRSLPLSALHEWQHFDCSHSDAEVIVADEILNTLLESQKQQHEAKCSGGGDISFIFEKSSVNTES